MTCRRGNVSLVQAEVGHNSSKSVLCGKMTTLVNISAVIVVQALQLFSLPMWASLCIGSCGLVACGPCSPHLPLQLVVLRISKRTHLFWFVINYIYLFSSWQIGLENGPSVKKWKPNSSSSTALSNYCKPAVYTVSPFCQPKLCTPMRCCNRRVIVSCTRLPCPRADMQHKQWLTEHVGQCKAHTQFGSD